MYVGDDCFSDWAGVENFGALIGDGAQGFGEVRLFEAPTDGYWFAVVELDAGGFGEASGIEILAHSRHHAGVVRADFEAFLCEFDRGLHHGGERQGPVILER